MIILELYESVYDFIQKTIKERKPLKGCEGHWEFAKYMPHPGSINENDARLLLGSISMSKSNLFGLECFFQENYRGIKLGEYIRNNLPNGLNMNGDQQIELEKLARRIAPVLFNS